MKAAIRIQKFAAEFCFIPLFGILKKIGRPIFFYIYNTLLGLKKKLFKSYNVSFQECVQTVSNRFGTHIAVIFIAIFVISHNLQAGSAESILAADRMIYSIFSGGSEDEIITDRAQTIAPYNPKISMANAVGVSYVLEATDFEQNIMEALPSTMAGGNTLLKPIISDDQESIQKQRLLEDIETYTVQDGDTFSSIAAEFGISINTILWENRLRLKDYIKPGQVLTILPTSGIRHTVKRGENMSKIASKYDVDAENILEFNQIASADAIQIGQKLIIPEGSPLPLPVAPTPIKKLAEKILNIKPTTKPKLIAGGMIWPAPGRVITQSWSWKHTGLDIDGITGDAIYAIADGTVAVSGWNTGGYGLQIVVQHSNGFKSRYAHCSKLLKQPGEAVRQGEVVCLMGSTGRSTGSHLHFEILQAGVRVNPLQYVKR
ncbi:MAG: Peptidase M23 [Parcubacteria group bacterium Gr01-1014_18]|nr:MAG: Peptidase M23 [Parcubacteria group bacterium Greene0416_36]TSC81022.1 MAG: Peptidase M23 [Parcubacteria group bacterium Gr01-1014_18]TSC98944.1 MAG: Peptidase M23 [Parcubacteria group bacterium Greene1014_20]TSD06764.1 MAG: Peptidase M23 [Parcubacteria group bacterium Greene0714_2]